MHLHLLLERCVGATVASTLYLLLVLDPVHVVEEHLLLVAHDFLRVHRRLRWVSNLRDVHFRILNSTGFWAFAVVLLHIWSSLTLWGTSDCDGRLSDSSRQFLLRGTSDAKPLHTLTRNLAAKMIHFICHGLLLMWTYLVEVMARFWRFYTPMTRIVRSQGPLLRLIHTGSCLRLLNLALFFLRKFMRKCILRDNRLLMERIADSFWRAKAMSVPIPTFLLFVYVLA